jgi:hypothetical protein
MMNPLLAEKLIARAEANRQRTGTLPGLDLRDVAWSTVEHYGYPHGQEVSMLAHYVGEQLGLNKETLERVKLAGLLHDLGRETPWQVADPNHRQRSADLAEKFLRSQSEVWHQQALIEETCWIIANHDLSAKELPTDPRLQALWDADSYDAARFSPGTVEGLKVFRERTKTDRLCTAWAKEANNKRVWLNHRGWK